MYTPGLWPQGINKTLSGRRPTPPILLGVALYLRARDLCGGRVLGSRRPGERKREEERDRGEAWGGVSQRRRRLKRGGWVGSGRRQLFALQIKREEILL